jgi:hypothetical protein
MKNERQAVIPTSGPTTLDAAMYAEGRKHADMKPIGTIKANMGIGRRGADQPKQTPKYCRHDG